MAKTMVWPPTPRSGRVPMVQGAEATRILVMATLSDLQTNPFNENSLSLGNITFRVEKATRARIEAALKRLRSMIHVEAIIESDDDGESEKTYTINFTDLETRKKRSVTVNG